MPPLKALALTLTAMMAGCSQTPSEVPVETLAFPVVRITGLGSKGGMPCRAEVVHTREHLSRMRVGLYSDVSDRSLSDPPVVIDSSAHGFEMDKIVGEHGGLWMMANPNGMMPIRFSLIRRQESGLPAARSLLAGCRFLGRVADDDTLARRGRDIRQAETMARILSILDE